MLAEVTYTLEKLEDIYFATQRWTYKKMLAVAGVCRMIKHNDSKIKIDDGTYKWLDVKKIKCVCLKLL